MVTSAFVRKRERAEIDAVFLDAQSSALAKEAREGTRSPVCHPQGLQKSKPSLRPYEASSIQSSFSRMASMWGLVMTTSSSSNSEGSDWVSMAPMRSTMGLEGKAQGRFYNRWLLLALSTWRPLCPQKDEDSEYVKQGPLVPGPNLTLVGLQFRALHRARQCVTEAGWKREVAQNEMSHWERGELQLR